jgi:transposase
MWLVEGYTQAKLKGFFMEIEFTGQVVFEQLGLGLEINDVSNQQADRSWSVRKTFKSYRPEQTLNWQVPKNILPEQHLIWFVRKIVAQLNLSEILFGYQAGDGRGQPPYDPGMMLTLLIYCYCTERESVRDIEQATYDDIACRIITGDQHPDHTTINNFRKQHLAALDNLFGQVLALAQEAGLVEFKNVAIDGTKVKANASKHKAMSYDRMCETEEKLEREIPQINVQIEATAAANPPLSPSQLTELQKDLAIREKRLPVIKASKAVLEEEAKQKVARERNEHEKIALQQGKKARKKVWKTKPDAKAQRNFTDPDSKIMPSKKTFVQGYNAQVAVDGLAQVIVGKFVTQKTNDKQQLLPMVRQIKARFGRLPDNILADSGFYSEANLKTDEWEELGITNLFIPPGKEEKGKRAQAPVGRIPKDATVVELMRRKLKTKAGHNIYRLRKSIVEPAIGQIKCALDFDAFRLRGLIQVEHEWGFVCTIHNILKIFRSGFQFFPSTA